MVETTGRRSAVEFSKIGVIDSNKCSWDWSESYIHVIAIYVAHIIKIGTSRVRESQLYKGCRRLPSYSSTLDSEVV